MQSEKQLRSLTTVKDYHGNFATKTFTVEGPISYVETTTQSQISLENATRSFDLYLNETEEQTQLIQDMQKKARQTDSIKGDKERERIVIRHQKIMN